MTLRCGCAAVVALLITLPALALEPCGDWQQVLPWPTDASLNGVAYGDGRYLAVGDSPYASWSQGQAADAYAVVLSRDPDARFAAYGSVVDKATGDLVLVVGR